jgi:hypothetical protein
LLLRILSRLQLPHVGEQLALLGSLDRWRHPVVAGVPSIVADRLVAIVEHVFVAHRACCQVLFGSARIALGCDLLLRSRVKLLANAMVVKNGAEQVAGDAMGGVGTSAAGSAAGKHPGNGINNGNKHSNDCSLTEC